MFERHYDSVERFFHHKVGAQNDDLIQTTFLGLLEGVERFRGEGNFAAFLFAIARNTLLKHLRNQRRDLRRFDPAVTSIAATGTSPIQELEAREQTALLHASLLRLPLDTQIMLELHYWESMKLEDIGLVFDMPINTVKTRMRRGRIALDEQMRALARTPQELEVTAGGLAGWAARLRDELR